MPRVPPKEQKTMFENTKAFSGFSADDIPAAKQFWRSSAVKMPFSSWSKPS